MSVKRTIDPVFLGMLRQARHAAALMALASVLAGASVAQETRARAAGGERSALQWLEAAQGAAARVNYSGTVVYESGGEMRTSRITHMFDGTRSFERVQRLDGKPREFIRMRSNGNDEVQCLYPEARRIVIEHRAADDAFPGLAGVSAATIMERYKLQIGAVERVAGIDCRLLVLEPRDGLRYGYRLWIDQGSGLLLRAQTLGERGEVLEQIAFTDIRIGERIDRARLKPAWPTTGWTVERSDYRKANSADSGWSVPTPVGFQKTKEVSRRMGNSDALQIVFTDGLATMSVFIEQAEQVADARAADARAADPVQTVGPTSAYTRRIADATVTVVGEVPPAAVRSVASSVEFRAPR